MLAIESAAVTGRGSVELAARTQAVLAILIADVLSCYSVAAQERACSWIALKHVVLQDQISGTVVSGVCLRKQLSSC